MEEEPLPPLTLSQLAETHPDLLAECVVGARCHDDGTTNSEGWVLTLADVARVAQTSRLFLSIAVGDLGWRLRVLGRSWSLAPIPMSGDAAVALWRAGDGDAGKMSVGELKAVLRARHGDGYPLPLEKGELRAAAAAALVGDLPLEGFDGDGWWRRLYRALRVGESVRRTRTMRDCSWKTRAFDASLTTWHSNSATSLMSR